MPSRESADKIIGRVLAKGRFGYNSFFTIKWLPNRQRINSYFFVISKKVDNRAVVRNKIRRLIRGWLKANQQNLKQGYNVVIVPKKKSALLASDALKQEIEKIFKRSELYKNE